MIPDTITAEELTSAIIRLFTDGDPVVPDAHFFGEEGRESLAREILLDIARHRETA